VSEQVITSHTVEETIALGKKIGQQLRGGEVIELVSDLGGGKTQLVRGLAAGMGSTDQVQSPTFTISRIYTAKRLELHHFDFYRLQDPGIIKLELAEAMHTPDVVVAIEWADTVQDILPADRLRIIITSTGESLREIRLEVGDKLDYLLDTGAV
jgi:tRNA threonylcarbamoyladenosine biosynthesis protein TsaE